MAEPSDAAEDQLARLLDVQRRFTRVVLDGGREREVASTLADILQCPVGILDQEGALLAAAPEDEDTAPLVLDELDDDTSATEVIRAGDREYGTIVAARRRDSLRQDQAVALELAAVAVAMRQAQAAAVAQEHDRFAAISLEGLISGHPSTVSEAIERASSLGWDLHRRRAVLLASVDPPVDRERLSGVLSNIAAAARATLGRDAIVWARSTTIAALVTVDTDEPSERREVAETLRAELNRRVSSATISIGVGRCVSRPEDLSRSFVEASRAVDVGRWAKGRHVIEVFDQLGLERLLASTPQEDLEGYVDQVLGSLIEHDRSMRRDLVATLAAWLEHRNIAEAARSLHLHYNTVKGRLDRIEAILGPVLSDHQRALECAIAIHIVRHYDGSWSRPS